MTRQCSIHNRQKSHSPSQISSGFAGGLATRGWRSLVINAERPTFNAQRPIQNPNWTLDVRRLASGVFLIFELGPNWGMIRGLFPFAHFAIDSGIYAPLRQAFTCKDCVDTQSTIFFKCAHLIVPPTEEPAFSMMQTKRVAQVQFIKLAESPSFILRAHDRAAPQIWSVNINIFRGHVEIAAHYQRGTFFFR